MASANGFPGLNFVSVESGVVDPVPSRDHGLAVAQHRGLQEHPELDLLPSEYFARTDQPTCFWDEQGSARSAIEQVGADHILFETDFPHPTGLTPGPASAALAPREHIRRGFVDLPEVDVRKVMYENAVRLYHLDCPV